jgi:hypothetical protein
VLKQKCDPAARFSPVYAEVVTELRCFELEPGGADFEHKTTVRMLSFVAIGKFANFGGF